MIDIIIVDDEAFSGQLLERVLKAVGTVRVLGTYINPVEALEKIFELKPEAIFLDIEMPELSGLQIAETIYESDLNTEVVFFTAYNQYAIEAFKVNALDYILKPINEKDVQRALNRIEARNNRKNQSLMKPSVEKQAAELKLFGTFNVYTEDRKKSVRFNGHKSSELLAYIFLNGKDGALSKWKIIDALWPDKDEEKGDINLRSTICRLNRTLKEENTNLRIISNHNSYKLEAYEIKSDIFLLEKFATPELSINSDNIGEYEKIVENCSDELLSEYNSEWCLIERKKYYHLYLNLVKKLIQYYESNLADRDKLIHLVDKVIDKEPYEIEFLLLALDLHYQKGGKTAIKVFFKNRIEPVYIDLGLEPEKEIMDKYKTMMME